MSIPNTTTAKTLLLVSVIAGLSMGNQSCQQANTRVLKMDVEIGSIAAKTVTLPTGEKVDFAYVANSLFYQEVMANDHFVMSNPVPTINTAATLAAAKAKLAAKIAKGVATEKDGVISTKDEDVLEQYGFMRQLENKAAALSAKASLSSAFTPTVAANVPLCLYDLPQAKLAGEVVSFEANWGVGVGIGYGSNGIPLPTGGTVGGSVKFNSARLQMGLRAVDPLNSLLLAAASGVSSQSSVNFALNFAAAALGLDFFYKTPLAKVVSSAEDKALASVVTDLIAQRSQKASWDDAWESRVIYDPEIADGDTHVVFRGGERYGMKVGDTFTVTNMHYKWADDTKPCLSALKYKVPVSATPLAELEVIQVGDNVAVAKVTKYLIEQNIEPGAQIKLLKLYVPPTTTQTKSGAKLASK